MHRFIPAFNDAEYPLTFVVPSKRNEYSFSLCCNTLEIHIGGRYGKRVPKHTWSIPLYECH